MTVMGFLTVAKSAAGSFLSSWMRDGDIGLATAKNTPLSLLSTHLPSDLHSDLRGQEKKTWTVRKREFDKLRALRQNDTSKDSKSDQQLVHASTTTDLREKTLTLKKIDDIEAQMSMQWWKTDLLDMNHRKNSKNHVSA